MQWQISSNDRYLSLFKVLHERAFSVSFLVCLHYKEALLQVKQGRRKRQGIGPANTPKQLINYSYFVLFMRRLTPAYMTINKQCQENINNLLCKMRQQYVANMDKGKFKWISRTGGCDVATALPSSRIMKFITLAFTTLVPRLRDLRYRFRRPCGFRHIMSSQSILVWRSRPLPS